MTLNMIKLHTCFVKKPGMKSNLLSSVMRHHIEVMMGFLLGINPSHSLYIYKYKLIAPWLNSITISQAGLCYLLYNLYPGVCTVSVNYWYLYFTYLDGQTNWVTRLIGFELMTGKVISLIDKLTMNLCTDQYLKLTQMTWFSNKMFASENWIDYQIFSVPSHQIWTNMKHW